VTEQNSLDDFLATAELAGTEFDSGTLIFQKLTEQELVLLSALDHLSK
jgi:hypothetical protein